MKLVSKYASTKVSYIFENEDGKEIYYEEWLNDSGKVIDSTAYDCYGEIIYDDEIICKIEAFIDVNLK